MCERRFVNDRLHWHGNPLRFGLLATIARVMAIEPVRPRIRRIRQRAVDLCPGPASPAPTDPSLVQVRRDVLGAHVRAVKSMQIEVEYLLHYRRFSGVDGQALLLAALVSKRFRLDG